MAVFRRRSKADFLYHFRVLLKGLLYALIWSDKSTEVFALLHSATILGLQQNPLFFTFIISLECFVDRTKTSLLSFHFSTVIPSLFSLAIISLRYNLVLITSIGFILRCVRSVPIRCVFLSFSLFAKSRLVYQLSVQTYDLYQINY